MILCTAQELMRLRLYPPTPPQKSLCVEGAQDEKLALPWGEKFVGGWGV